MTFLGAAAIALQALGLVVTALGLRITWLQFREPGEALLDPVIHALKRLDPRRRRDRTALAGVADGLGMANDASLRVTFGTLPAGDRQAIDTLAQRVQGLRENLETLATDLRRDIVGVGRRVEGLDGRVRAEVDRLDRADRRVATDGLRLESLGLVIIAVGTLVQLFDGLSRSAT